MKTLAMETTTVGVVGHTGTVGSAVFSFYKHSGYRVVGFSPSNHRQKDITNWQKLEEATVIFVCVPTPFDYKTNKADLSIVSDVVSKMPISKIVVIKSTILPGTTEQLQAARPDLRILFNPEFLSRKTAAKDFLKPERQIVGFTQSSATIAQDILNLLPQGTYNALMTASEAELVKYAHNMFGALTITYANHLYDVSQALKIKYSAVMGAFTSPRDLKGLKRYTTIYHNHKRGFGGPCFPKDIRSFAIFCQNIGVEIEVIQAAINANQRLLSSQNITEQAAEKL